MAQKILFSELFRVKHGFAFQGEYFSDSGRYVLVTPGSFYEEGGFRDQGNKKKWYTAEAPDGYILDKGQLIIVMTEQAEGLLGSAALVPESNTYLHNQRIGLVVDINVNRVCKGFLFLLFNANNVRAQIAASASGTKVRHTSPERIGRVAVDLPPLNSQRRIVDTISAYDDLIENNRRRMAKLEEAARLLYQEWFVRLRFPGHEHTRIVNGMPDDWKTAPLRDVSQFIGRGIAPQYDDEGGSLVINQKCVRNNQLDLALARRQSRTIPDDKRVRLGDILINSTGEGTLGRVAQVKIQIESCTVDSHITIVRPSADIGVCYAGCVVSEYQPILARAGRGATNQTELSRDYIGSLSIHVPLKHIVSAFDSLAEPIFKQVSILALQNEKLRAARDLLLPRLMSGEISV